MTTLSRSEFETLRKHGVNQMVQDKQLQENILKLKVQAGQYLWVHQTTWRGEPCLQLPQDLFAVAEIVHDTQPQIIIELGVAWGGSFLFYDDLATRYGGYVLGVDRYVPGDLKTRLYSKCRPSLSITTSALLEGDTTDNQVVAIVKAAAKGLKTLLILDSDHTHEHVLSELRCYADLVSKGCYIVVCDTTLAYQPSQAHYRERPWNRESNPKTAVDAFLKETDRFEVDWERSNKLLLTNCIGGFLKAVR